MVDYEIHDKIVEVKIVVAKTQGYDIKKGLKKLAWYCAEAVITGLVVLWQDDVRFIALVPIIEVVHNWIKHRKSFFTFFFTFHI